MNCSITFNGTTTSTTIWSFSKSILPLLVIITGSFGNILVILSVSLYRKLRVLNHNLFILSLALADCLVAIFVMPFNLSLIITQGQWLFGPLLCTIFNSNDVFFSTASIIHLCCISVDRHIAIIHPLNYDTIMTKSRVCLMLFLCWLSSMLISYIPIYTGIYTTPDHLELLRNCTNICLFKVNRIYAIISSTVSFWIPCIIMVAIYVRIFKEAQRHERKLYDLQKTLVRRKSNRHFNSNNNHLNDPYNSPGGNSNAALIMQSSASSSQQGQKQRREHKAAKTLGIIMGCFIVCWLPFFLWYTITNICGDHCPYPDLLVDIFFWIGYFNSSLNPLIYAFYNREFRCAFRQILKCQRHLILRSNSFQLNDLNNATYMSDNYQRNGSGSISASNKLLNDSSPSSNNRRRRYLRNQMLKSNSISCSNQN